MAFDALPPMSRLSEARPRMDSKILGKCVAVWRRAAAGKNGRQSTVLHVGET
jgi:hypothetical protein